MSGINPEGFAFTLGGVTDGYLFENFALDFLAKVLGYRFIPAGQIHDLGIDGFERTHVREGSETFIYQMSIQQDYMEKLRDSLTKLKANKIRVDKFVYVTNRRVKSHDKLADDLLAKFKIPVTIWDVDWFKIHVNDSEQTITSHRIWIESNYHQYTKPGTSYTIADLEGDPRLYVFLRQQVDTYGGISPLDHILADTLILFALEGTDPDQGILRTRDEILEEVVKHIKFDPAQLLHLIDRRLQALARKPRRINHHQKQNAYCLPYETRLEIENRNIEDVTLLEGFRESTLARLQSYLDAHNIQLDDAFDLVEQVIHSLFRSAGLELADFILHGQHAGSLAASLPEAISEVIDRSTAKMKDRAQVKRALLITLREIVYTGSASQLEYLRRLSLSYTMLFLLQCDPKLSLYFSTLASKLNVYVDNSILIPAMSEYYLDPHNRRYRNLLVAANQAGVKLVVNESIVTELAYHFRHIRDVYRSEYAGSEGLYGEEYIPEIMIRAYFYAHLRDQVSTFDEFLDNFVSVGSPMINQQLIDWLAVEFGVRFVSDDSLDIVLSTAEVRTLTDALEPFKPTRIHAERDAKMVLTVHALRSKRNEAGDSGIFGYSTWWLSKDTTTEKAVRGVFGRRFPMTCYMRPGFLFQSISLAPSKGAVDQAFSNLLPSMVGIALSYHLPPEVSEVVHRFVKDHQDKSPARVRAILRELSDTIKADTKPSREAVSTFLRGYQTELTSPQRS